ncbi:hypothetical protein ACWIGM_08125 [Bosea sp. NPDC055332]
MTGPRSLIALAFGARIASALLALVVAIVVAPAVFGFYGRLQAIGLVFAVFAVFRLERAIVTAPSVAEAVRVTRNALLILPASSLVAVAAAFALNPDLPAQHPHHGFALLLLVAFLARGVLLLVNAWFLRSGDQMRLSGLILAQAIGQFTAQIVLLATGWPPLAMLIAGEIIGAALAAAMVSAGHGALLRLLMRPRWTPRVMARWHRLVVFNLPAALASQTLVALPLITVGRLADHATTGHIALALRIADAPMQLLASAATSFIVASGAWRGRGSSTSPAVFALIYLAGVLLFVALLAGGAQALNLVVIEGRIAATGAYIPIACLLTGAIALGGPHAELVAFAGAERRAFAIHLMALAAGLLVFQLATEPVTALLCFAVIAGLRSLALWLVLPHLFKAGTDKQDHDEAA